jgi:hypothetical protein
MAYWILLQALSEQKQQRASEKLRRPSSAVGTSREGHRSPRSDREGQHRRWGQLVRFRAGGGGAQSAVRESPAPLWMSAAQNGHFV